MMTSDDFVNLVRISCYLYKLYTDELEVNPDAYKSPVFEAVRVASDSIDNILDSYVKSL